MLISLFLIAKSQWINIILKVCGRKEVGGKRQNINLINAYGRKIEMSEK